MKTKLWRSCQTVFLSNCQKKFVSQVTRFFSLSQLIDVSVNAAPSILAVDLYFKGNIIYNLMPDMISRISTDNDVTFDDFNAIMK